jgi:uncharacterized tellurite resistance protein B-like protein
MHIVAGLAAVIGALLLILWRLQQASHAVRDIGDAADDARGFFRRWAWRRKSGVNPLYAVTDPREAATAMMAATAEIDGALTELERVTILRLVMAKFDATAGQAEELLAQSRWLVKDRTDLAETFRRLSPVIRRTCSTKEQSDLIEMLQAVATANGPADASITTDIKWLTQSLQLQAK